MLIFRSYRLKCNALDYQGCEDHQMMKFAIIVAPFLRFLLNDDVFPLTAIPLFLPSRHGRGCDNR